MLYNRQYRGKKHMKQTNEKTHIKMVLDMPSHLHRQLMEERTETGSYMNTIIFQALEEHFGFYKKKR